MKHGRLVIIFYYTIAKYIKERIISSFSSNCRIAFHSVKLQEPPSLPVAVLFVHNKCHKIHQVSGRSRREFCSLWTLESERWDNGRVLSQNGGQKMSTF